MRLPKFLMLYTGQVVRRVREYGDEYIKDSGQWTVNIQIRDNGTMYVYDGTGIPESVHDTNGKEHRMLGMAAMETTRHHWDVNNQRRSGYKII